MRTNKKQLRNKPKLPQVEQKLESIQTSLDNSTPHDWYQVTTITTHTGKKITFSKLTEWPEWYHNFWAVCQKTAEGRKKRPVPILTPWQKYRRGYLTFFAMVKEYL
jgi:hypothetical protein